MANEPKTQAPEAPAKKQSTRGYKVLSNLRHNGKHYVKGSRVELTAKDAKPLVQAKVVEPVGAPSDPASADSANSEE